MCQRRALRLSNSEPPMRRRQAKPNAPWLPAPVPAPPPYLPDENKRMAGKHTYILGLNTYDHDVSACLLRDGEIAVAIAKERITREKHASGFYKEVVDYCLKAEGISLDDIELIVRNCYILPVGE